jgi:VanZ family protein
VPVLIWIGVLVLESSDIGSSEHTGLILRRLWSALFGLPEELTFETVHHLIRKTGHFVGYAILSWLIFRALRGTWRSRQAIITRAREYFWQLRWSVFAILGTAMAASADEIHQTFNPARTGRWQDVIIDTSGALVLQILLYISIQYRGRKAEPLPSTS